MSLKPLPPNGNLQQIDTANPAANELSALSPLDGRYLAKTHTLREYFSEYALFRYRVLVEVEYLIALCKELGEYSPEDTRWQLSDTQVDGLQELYLKFSLEDAATIKQTEAITNHDVKAVEYWLKDKLQIHGLGALTEYVHFGLTSQDVNNTANPLMLKDAWFQALLPQWQITIRTMKQQANDWSGIAMLARTHGQPASPTLLGREWMVFITRLEGQLELISQIPWSAKFGGATGGFNAHAVAYPAINWHQFGDRFVNNQLGLNRTTYTTQIEPYDNLAAFLDGLRRLDNILIDFARDVWHYISIGYFKQKTKAGEIGSSAMPHKVNPIDFENAEGNLGMANAILEHLSNKLPISRLQRDLTDSTVLRNLGVPLGHQLLALSSLKKGLGKLELHENAISNDLSNTPEVLAEAVQTILRREGYPKPYEALKDLTRGKGGFTLENLHVFIRNLNVNEAVKQELLALTPHNYTGQAPNGYGQAS